MRTYVTELVQTNPDAILANGSPAVAALQQETRGGKADILQGRVRASFRLMHRNKRPWTTSASWIVQYVSGSPWIRAQFVRIPGSALGDVTRQRFVQV